MKTYLIDGRQYATAAALHQALKIMMDLPDYYGGNADALHDCLGGRRPVTLWVADAGEGEVAGALEKVCRVVEDLNGTVVRL